jgi:hypothetical protein
MAPKAMAPGRGEWFLDQAVGKIAAKHSAARNVSGIASELPMASD